MPYRPKDIYRGRRKFRVPLNIFLFVLALLIFGGVTMFYVLQRYMVYDANGATLQLPFTGGEAAGPGDDGVSETAAPTFEPVEVQVVWEAPDFADVDMGTWDELKPVQGLFIPYTTVTDSAALASSVAAVETGDYTAAVLEMKSADGHLAWPSECETARAYLTSGSVDVKTSVEALHAAGKTVAAQISCFSDWLLLQHNWSFALRYADGSVCQTEAGNYWVDPYNRTIRAYLIDLSRELAELGFDEIILADLTHPLSESGFTYSETMATEPDPVVAVCQTGQRIAEALADTGTAVSVRLDVNSLRAGQGSLSGQDLGIFWRLFARLYCATYADMLESDRTMATADMNGGNPDARFVPVVPAVPETGGSYLIG